MTIPKNDSPPIVVLTGANGFVGSHVARALVDDGAVVRAVVRRAGTAPALPGVEEHVGDFQDAALAARVLSGADAAVTTVHPMWSDGETQHRVALEGTLGFVRAARDAGVARLVQLSSAAAYLHPLSADDVDEDSPLVGDDGGHYALTKRDTDAALSEIDGITGFLVRPPMILGPGETSEFNTIRPTGLRADPAHRRLNPAMSASWIHVTDLAALVSGLATGRLPEGPAAESTRNTWTPVNASTGRLTVGEYLTTVLGAIGTEPDWTDEPVWTGDIRGDRARSWGWRPAVELSQALEELAADVRAAS